MVDGRKMIAGSAKFISGRIAVSQELQSRAAAFAADGKTPLFFAADGKLLGIIAVAGRRQDTTLLCCGWKASWNYRGR